MLLAVIPLAMWSGELAAPRLAKRAAVAARRDGADDPALDDPQRDRDGRLHPGGHQRQHHALVGPQQRGQRRDRLRPAGAAGAHPETAQPDRARGREAKLLRKEAIHWAIRNPPKELGLIPRKLLALGNATSQVFPIWFNAEGDCEVGTSSQLVFSVLGDALDYFLILLAHRGAGADRRAAPVALHPLMRGALAYLAASLVTYGFVYYGQFRYRLAMEPLMILVATPLLIALWQGRGAPAGGVVRRLAARPHARPGRARAAAPSSCALPGCSSTAAPTRPTTRSTTRPSTSSPPRASRTERPLHRPGLPADRGLAARVPVPRLAAVPRLRRAAEPRAALNVILATATVVLIYLIAERMFGRREARVAAASSRSCRARST